MSVHAPDDFREIADLLGPDGLGLLERLEVRSFTITSGAPKNGTGREVYMLYYHPLDEGGGSAGAFPFEFLSQGTRRIIRMVVAMVADQSRVMLIEHPEDGIHRGLIRKVFSLLKTYSDPGQVIVTTHSELVLDMLDPTEVRLVSMEGGVTRARALDTEEVAQARRYVKEAGAFSDYLESEFGL